MQCSASQRQSSTHSAALQEIAKRFGSQFVSFLGSDALSIDVAKGSRPACALSLDMPWAEKSFIMESIDYLQPKAVREGGRLAYMAFSGRRHMSWESELERVDAMLAASPQSPCQLARELCL